MASSVGKLATLIAFALAATLGVGIVLMLATGGTDRDTVQGVEAAPRAQTPFDQGGTRQSAFL